MTKPKPEEEKLFLPDPQPDPVEVKVRAVCGFLVGLVVAAATWLKLRGLGPTWTILLFTGVPAGFAYCAARWGDEFWSWWRD